MCMLIYVCVGVVYVWCIYVLMYVCVWRMNGYSVCMCIVYICVDVHMCMVYVWVWCMYVLMYVCVDVWCMYAYRVNMC